jgi:hypothetical protein
MGEFDVPVVCLIAINHPAWRKKKRTSPADAGGSWFTCHLADWRRFRRYESRIANKTAPSHETSERGNFGIYEDRRFLALKNGGKREQVNKVERYVGGFCIGKQMEKMPIPKAIEARVDFHMIS